MSTQNEIVEILAMLAAAYPRFSLTKDTITVYCRLLQDIPATLLQAAALDCATTRDFFPSVHELREAVTEIRNKINGIPTVYEAWAELRKAGDGYEEYEIKDDEGFSYPRTRQYEFSHPIIKQVAEMMGWPLDFPDENNIMADRAHFFKAYTAQLAKYIGEEIQLPEVKKYIEDSKPNAEVLKLAERMRA